MGNFVGGPPGSGKYMSIDTAGGTLVKSGPGSLQAVVINTGTASATVSLFDGTTSAGISMGVINAASEFDLSYGLQFNTGLFVETAGTPNITIVYF